MSALADLDWQFVIVTLAALWGGWILLRPLWASRKSEKPVGACGRCSSASCKPAEASGASGVSASFSGSGSGLVSIGSGMPRKAKSNTGPPGGGA
ncbi:MAG TPA: hypothetical protein VJ885_00800 [Thermoanaerobaculia bacterium]|nr:hypothetical protein [Thermoanaerobaculia bacterium]